MQSKSFHSPTNWVFQQDSSDSTPTQIYITIHIISSNLPCHRKRDFKFHSSVICMDNPVGFSLNVKFCVPIIVTYLGKIQLENYFKFCITRLIYTTFSLITINSTLCVNFMIKTHSKSTNDNTRNEFSDLILGRKHVS